MKPFEPELGGHLQMRQFLETKHKLHVRNVVPQFRPVASCSCSGATSTQLPAPRVRFQLRYRSRLALILIHARLAFRRWRPNLRKAWARLLARIWRSQAAISASVWPRN